MADEKVKIPDFMKSYYNRTNYEGQAILDKVAKRYHERYQNIHTKIGEQQAIFDSHMGKKARKIDPAPHVGMLQEEFRKETEKIAREHPTNERTQQQKDDKALKQAEFLRQIAEKRKQKQERKEAKTEQTKGKGSEQSKEKAEQHPKSAKELYKENLQAIRERKAEQRPKMR